MRLHPVIAALGKHKAGAFLIGLQIALTLAIVCNVIFIVAMKVQRIERPTGLDERNLFLIVQSFIGAPAGSDPASLGKLDSLQRTDLATLRSLPDVQSATPVNSLPLLRINWVQGVSLKPGQVHDTTNANLFYGGQSMLRTLGLELVAGRDFTRADVRQRAMDGKIAPPLVIVTRALADRLFPHGDAVGKPIYVNSNTAPSTIVGVVARMLTAAPDGWDSIAYDAVLVPARIDDASTMYAVRARPGRMHAAMREARKALFKVDPLRVIQQTSRYSPDGIHSYAQIREMGYALDIFLTHALILIGVILLAVTGIGMTGLTSFWVNQRHKQIGIRRALGATRSDILRYFRLENLLIAGSGCVAGALLAMGINLLLLRRFQMERMPVWYVLAGVAVILVLGQVAVWSPARRASRVPPVVATRSV